MEKWRQVSVINHPFVCPFECERFGALGRTRQMDVEFVSEAGMRHVQWLFCQLSPDMHPELGSRWVKRGCNALERWSWRRVTLERYSLTPYPQPKGLPHQLLSTQLL